jgi:hypothetical protein
MGVAREDHAIHIDSTGDVHIYSCTTAPPMKVEVSDEAGWPERGALFTAAAALRA